MKDQAVAVEEPVDDRATQLTMHEGAARPTRRRKPVMTRIRDVAFSESARVWAARIALIVVVVGVWELAAARGWIDPFFYGRPTLIWETLVDMLGTSEFWSAVGITLREATLGLALGVAVGCLFGFVFAALPFLYRVLDPIIYALYSLPRIALYPLFVIWLGLGSTPKVVLAFSIVVFIMLLNTYVGLTTIDRDLVNAVKLMGASSRFVLRTVRLPAIVPWLAAGFRLSASYALLAAILGEMLSSDNGIGKLLVDYQSFFNTNGIFALLLVLGILAVLISGVGQLIEAHFSKWRATETSLPQ